MCECFKSFINKFNINNIILNNLLLYIMFSNKQINVGDSVVITGVSGKFPNCQNIKQFKENLYNGVCVKEI